jgi:hypothetical protein
VMIVAAAAKAMASVATTKNLDVGLQKPIPALY